MDRKQKEDLDAAVVAAIAAGNYTMAMIHDAVQIFAKDDRSVDRSLQRLRKRGVINHANRAWALTVQPTIDQAAGCKAAVAAMLARDELGAIPADVVAAAVAHRDAPTDRKAKKALSSALYAWLGELWKKPAKAAG